MSGEDKEAIKKLQQEIVALYKDVKTVQVEVNDIKEEALTNGVRGSQTSLKTGSANNDAQSIAVEQVNEIKTRI